MTTRQDEATPVFWLMTNGNKILNLMKSKIFDICRAEPALSPSTASGPSSTEGPSCHASKPIPQTLTFRLIALGLVLGALASACGPAPEEVAESNDPLAALAVAAQSEHYDGRFWRLQHSQEPDLYEKAVTYCQGEHEAGRLEVRPNCVPVLQAKALIDSMSRPRRQGRGYTGILKEDAANGSSQAAETTGGGRQR